MRSPSPRPLPRPRDPLPRLAEAATTAAATSASEPARRRSRPISPALQAAYQAAFGVPGVANHTNPVYMAGFGNNRQATGYHDRLWARGVVLDRKGKRVAIVAVDLIGYFKNEIDTIRGLVSPSSNVDFVLVASTHQHEGPDTLGIWGANELSSGIDYGYLDFVNATVADCIDEARREPREGARLLRHREQRRALARDRSRGRWLRRVRRQGARGRRGARAGDPRKNRRSEHRHHAAHRAQGERSRRAGDAGELREPPGEPRLEQHA